VKNVNSADGKTTKSQRDRKDESVTNDNTRNQKKLLSDTDKRRDNKPQTARKRPVTGKRPKQQEKTTTRNNDRKN
jgi:hypothetical protein